MSRLPPDTTRAVHSVKAERTVDAPPEVVWNAILDFPSYTTWNSFVRNMAITDSMFRPLSAHPNPTEGTHILMHVRMPPRGLDDDDKGLRSTKGVITYIDEARHRVVWEQVSYPKWLLRTERWQEVTEEQVDGKTATKYMTVEVCVASTWMSFKDAIEISFFRPSMDLRLG